MGLFNWLFGDDRFDYEIEQCEEDVWKDAQDTAREYTIYYTDGGERTVRGVYRLDKTGNFVDVYVYDTEQPRWIHGDFAGVDKEMNPNISINNDAIEDIVLDHEYTLRSEMKATKISDVAVYDDGREELLSSNLQYDETTFNAWREY